MGWTGTKGPWNDPHEPDFGASRLGPYSLFVVRNDTGGHFCCYLTVPPGHPWNGRRELRVPPRGGISYASASIPAHLAKRARIVGPEGYWWIGFHVAHPDLGDAVPLAPAEGAEYRDFVFAAQLLSSFALAAQQAISN